VANEFFEVLEAITLQSTRAVELGYHPENSIGPNTDAERLAAVAAVMVRNRPFIRFGGLIDARQQLIYPCIIDRPLTTGANYEEIFAPVLFVQRFNDDSELLSYIHDTRYRRRAMYFTVFGNCPLLEHASLQKIHPNDTVIINNDLLSKERGTEPYGGYGPEASAIEFGKARLSTPLLTQREVFRFLVEPWSRANHEPNGACSGTLLMNERSEATALSGQSSNDRMRLMSKLDLARQSRPELYQSARPATDSNDRLQQRFGWLPPGEMSGTVVRVVGRVMSSRNSGMFMDIRDHTGKIQVYVTRDESGNNQAGSALSLVGVGDLISRREQFVERLEESLQSMPSTSSSWRSV
jgi:hypothetical protein